MATYTGDSITFRMAYVPGGVTFPTGRDDSGTGTVTAAYEIGETEVTYELWHAVRAWAESNGYTFYNNPGREGGSPSSENTTPGANKQEPVTMVTWFDAVVWLNALTEWVNVKEGKNLTPVYYYESGCTTVARDSDPSSNFEKEDSSHSCASAYAKSGASGFRLPSSNEWELAARWRNDAVNTVSGYTNPYFTQGDSASGAVADYNDTTANDAVAWWHSGNASKTQAVKGKGANALGLYDMSGNVLEWCYDWSPSYIGSSRIMRGGSWITSAGPLQVGYVYSFYPETRIYDYGFRPARTAN
jgi:formylglycine-generating enzyme required for sulfatase activity